MGVATFGLTALGVATLGDAALGVATFGLAILGVAGVGVATCGLGLLMSETGHGKKRKADEIDPQTVDVPAKIHINRHHPRFRDYY